MSVDFAAVCQSKDDAVKKTIVIVSEVNDRKQLTKCYDDWAKTYDEDMVTIHHYEPLHSTEVVAQLLGDRKDALILDAPAGTGKSGELLNKKGYTNIDALDASTGMLEIAKKRNVYKNFIVSYLGTNRLDIESGKYDLVMNVGALLDNHVKEDCFPELRRITKKGGHVVLAVEDPVEELKNESQTAFRRRLEAKLKSMEDEGQWKLLETKRLDSVFMDNPGTIYVLEVL